MKDRTSTPADAETLESAAQRRNDDSADEEPICQDAYEATMEVIATEENVWRAYKRVARNRGAPGPDGETIEVLGRRLESEMLTLLRTLRDGRYRPGDVRGVRIPKPGGGERELGIPNVLDRVVQQAILQVLTPVFDPTFSDASFGFRPGRRAHGALQCARDHIRSGNDWVVNLDLRKFFDRVNHDVLMARVARRVRDKTLLQLIGRYLRAGMMRGGITSPRKQGTPQGGPLSPLLSNILLDDLDQWLEKRGHLFVRYADDFLIFKRSDRAAERVKSSVTQFLEQKLRLQVNEEKSSMERPETLVYLGYTFYEMTGGYQLQASETALRRLRARLLPHLTRWGRGRTLKRTIAALNPILRGWFHYFSLGAVRWQTLQIDGWVRRHLRCLMWRRWRKGKTRYLNLTALGVKPKMAACLAATQRGPWHSSVSPQLSIAMPNRYFHDRGLFNLRNAYAGRSMR